MLLGALRSYFLDSSLCYHVRWAKKDPVKKTRIQTLAMVGAVFIALMGTNILSSPANATVDIQARQKAGSSYESG